MSEGNEKLAVEIPNPLSGGGAVGAEVNPVPSAPTFQTERITDSFLAELVPLFKAHWKEVAHYEDIPLDPDLDKYRLFDKLGVLRIYTARLAGALIGYSIFIVQPHPHYQGSIYANNDIIFISPERRGFGRKFIAWCDDELRKDGVRVVAHHVKAAHNWTPMLFRMGYELQDLICTRRLDRWGTAAQLA